MMGALHQVSGWLAWALAIPVVIVTLYMFAIVLGSWFHRSRRREPDRLPTFAVIVPAHDEEQGIASTVAQLLATDYPPERLRVFVVADNCRDNTARVAGEAGARVMVRHDEHSRGKGQALDWMLRQHRELLASADLIAFIDADMLVDRQFLRAMAGAFSGSRSVVAQGRYLVANPARSILSAIGYASFCYVNHVRPAGRCFWGGTADLKGSGMVFRADFLLPRGWPAHSIAEDIQLGKDLMLEGIGVAYVPEAQVSSEIPSTISQVRVQQSRWEQGRGQVHTSLLPRLLRAFVTRPSMLLFDGLLDLAVPPLSVLLLVNAAGLALGWWGGVAAIWVFAASLGVFGLAVLSGLLQNRAPAGVFGRLLAAPVFVVWKLLLLLSLTLSRRPVGWQRTPRDPR